MRIFCVAVSLGVLSGFSNNALADPKAYCDLLSKDYADGKTTEVDLWQISYRNAFTTCMTQYESPDRALKKESVKKAIKIANIPRQKRKPLLAPGSIAWNEYCASKYTSYNKSTGTYKSYSGKAKPCLVPSG
jgi:hypothetical protein